MTVMEEIASTERGIAETLGDMATHDEGNRAARRRKLAEDAIEGAREADRRRAQLQHLAERWSEHAGVVTLHQLLAHAVGVLAELARTEQDIADTLTGLARHDGSPLAAQQRQLAKAAAAARTTPVTRHKTCTSWPEPAQPAHGPTSTKDQQIPHEPSGLAPPRAAQPAMAARRSRRRPGELAVEVGEGPFASGQVRGPDVQSRGVPAQCPTR
jgi:hypothetical protein